MSNKIKSTVRIAGLTTAHAKAEGWADQVLSLVDPKYKSFLKFESPDKHLIVRFEDIDWEAPGEKFPKRDHIQEALDFVDDSKKIVIHCHAGLCRSTGVALGVLVRRGLSFDEAIDHIVDESPEAWPNNLVVSHVDAILGHEGNLEEALRKWKKKTKPPSWMRPDWRR